MKRIWTLVALVASYPVILVAAYLLEGQQFFLLLFPVLSTGTILGTAAIVLLYRDQKGRPSR